MKKYLMLLFLWIPLFSCEEEIPDFTPTVEHWYDGLFKVWRKKSIIRNLETGQVTTNEVRDLDLQYIFKRDAILRSTNGGASFDELTDFFLSLDSISYTYPNEGLSESFYVREVFRMKNGDPRLRDIVGPRDEEYPELDEFYLFLELENKKKTQGENSEITQVLFLYSEGFAE
ncbi:MAG: hypothetical protein KFF73_15680 [Cyclobacteriaceae bacterium]|nr:hypothetical protein [Cyclobacteriaceae bacterium]